MLTIAIPDTPFGHGSAVRPATTRAHPKMVGFTEPEESLVPPAVSSPPAAKTTSRPRPVSAPSDVAPAVADAAAVQAQPGTPAAAETADIAAAPSAAGGHKPSESPPSDRPLGTSQANRPATDRSETPIGAPSPLVGAAHTEAATPAERPVMRNRRLYRRAVLDAALEVDGQPARLLDLSMGGFAAANAPRLVPDTIVPVMVRLAIDGVEISTRMRARMIYSEVPRSGGRFVDLTPSQTAFLRYVVTWRGGSIGTLGATTLLEAITRSPEGGHPALPRLPPRQEARAPWWSRWFGRLIGVRRGD